MQKYAIFSECARDSSAAIRKLQMAASIRTLLKIKMNICNSLLLFAFSNDNTFGTKQIFYFKIAYKYPRDLWTEMLKQWSTGVKIQKVYKQLFTFLF